MLSEAEIPRFYYNITADMPNKPLPPLHPGTRQAITPDLLEPLFPKELILQEVSSERFIEIPAEVRKIYASWRPTPLFRATGLEKLLDTPAKIYYKYEGVSPAGSHKPNTAVAQAFTARWKGLSALLPKLAQGSGVPHWLMPARCLAWNARCLW